MATITISNATSTYTVGASDVLEVQSGGISQSSLVLSDGVEHIDFGGRSVGDTLNLYAWQVVSSGGAADGAILNGAEQIVSSGGMATNTKAYNVGYQKVASGGTAIATRIGSGGIQTTFGQVTGAIVNDGGTQNVYPGGMATYTTVNSGGEQDVFHGGTASNTTIAGGLVTVEDGAFTSGPITFAGSGTLNLQASVGSGTNTVFRSEIDGFGPGDTIDLSGFAYVPGSTRATISGSRLTVSNGSATETFILGSTHAPFVAATQDGSGGISVMAVPVVPPTVVGGGAATTVSEGAVTPFATATLTDLNANSTDVLTIVMSGPGGTLADGAGFSGLVRNPDGSYALSGTAAAVTAELRALRFTPTAGQANTSSTTRFALWDATTVGTSATNAGTMVVDIDPAVAPVVTDGGVVMTASERVVSPFTTVTVADPNANSTETLTIVMKGAAGTLADGAGFSGLARNPDGSYVLSGTAAAVTAELQALRFTPTTAGQANTGTKTRFALTDTTTAGTSATNSATTVVDLDPAVPPTVVGGGSATTVSEGVVAPFAAASIADPNAGSTDLLTIAMSGAGGTLADGAGFSGLAQNPDGSYALSGTAAAVTAELQALRFTPAAGQANTASTTTFALWDATAVRTSATNSGTTVVDLDPAVAPTVVGGGAATTVSEGVVTPFAAASIADPNAGSTETLTIALAGAGGTLADGAGFSGLARNPDGSYVLSGTAAAVTAELRALRFTPTAGPAGTAATTTFTLTDATTAGTSAMAAGAAVTDTDPAAAPAATTGGGTTPAAADTVSLSSAVTYAGGLFTLTGTAASAAGVSGVEISAVLDDGSRQDLGAATLDGDGAFTFQDAVGQSSQGFFEATLTDGAGHQTVSADPGFSLTGGFDQSDLLPRQTLYAPDGSDMSSTSVFAADGSRHVTIEASGQTLASNFFDTFHNHGTPGRTFVFDPGHGLDVVQGFRADGTDHDTLSFLGADFGGSLAALLGGARDVTGGVAIVDPTSGDTVKLTGVSAAELAHNRQDVAFHA